jgi:putative transcriptional regulator
MLASKGVVGYFHDAIRLLNRKGDSVIRYRLRERIADYQFRTGKRLTFEEIANETGIHRTTLSKIVNHRNYNTTTDNVDKLCRFFDCQIGDLMEYVEVFEEE